MGTYPRRRRCWLWTGYTKNGYPAISIHDRDHGVHRLSLTIASGTEPNFACHTCDTPRCWNPEHLFDGTPLDNVHDAMSKGRAAPPPHHRGERNPKAHLSDAQVGDLRRRWATGKYKQRDIAALFNVSQSTVWRLVHGEVRI